MGNINHYEWHDENSGWEKWPTEGPQAPPNFSEEPGAQSWLLQALRAPPGSSGGALAFQWFKLDLFIFFSFQTVI